MLEPINKENFNQVLNRFSTTELESLVEKFPYFHQAHILLAKKYQQQNNPRFDQQLQLAALYTQDRELLYSIFRAKEVIANIPTVETVPDKEELPVAPPLALIEETKLPDERGVENKEQKEEVVSAPVIEHTDEPVLSNNDNFASELKSEPSETPDVEATDEPIILLQPDAIPELNTETEVKIGSEENIEIRATEETEPLIENEDVVAETIKTGEFSATEPHTFEEWLRAYAQTEPLKIAELAKEVIPEEPEKQDEELEKLYLTNIPVNLQELVEEETHYSKGLDRFIEEQIQKHKGTRPKTPLNENDIDNELVTETMAKVYEMQKKYARAINCYKALALKYPEKNDFFAARINYLKNIT